MANSLSGISGIFGGTTITTTNTSANTWLQDTTTNISSPASQITTWPPMQFTDPVVPYTDITEEHIALFKQLLEKRTKRELNDLASALAGSIDGDVKTVRTMLKLFPALLALAKITERLEE